MQQLCAFQRMVRLSAALIVACVLGAPSAPVSAAPRATEPEQSRSNRPAVPAPKPSPAKPTPRAAAQAKPTVKKSYSSSASRVRAARLAKARAEAQARAQRELETPRYKLDAAGQQVPDVRAAAAIIYNPETNEVLWESNAQDLRSIASITKVMTALVFLESALPVSTPLIVQRADVYRASTTYLRAGYRVTADDLLNLLLIGSDNGAARALARISPYGSEGFIQRMNEKAAELGLERTRYADPSGLLDSNVSSAYDMARLIAFASADERIGSIMRKAQHTVYSDKTTINVKSTNQLVKNGELNILGAKTGFINRSGYCLATLLRLPQTGQQVAVVVLGAQSNQSRFWETRHLFNWMTTHTRQLFGLASQQQQQQQQQ